MHVTEVCFMGKFRQEFLLKHTHRSPVVPKVSSLSHAIQGGWGFAWSDFLDR